MKNNQDYAAITDPVQRAQAISRELSELDARRVLLAQLRAEAVAQVVANTGNNQSKAARALGIHVTRVRQILTAAQSKK